MISIETKRLHTYCIDSVSKNLNKTADTSVGWSEQDYFPCSQTPLWKELLAPVVIHQGPIFPIHFNPALDTALRPGRRSRLSRRAAGASRAPLLARAADVERQPDAQEELAQHRPQLGDQVELHDLTQVRVVRGSVGPELAKTQKQDVILDR